MKKETWVFHIRHGKIVRLYPFKVICPMITGHGAMAKKQLGQLSVDNLRTICGQSEPWDSNSVKIWNLFCVNNPLPTALSIPFVLKQADSFEEPNRPSGVFGDKSCS